MLKINTNEFWNYYLKLNMIILPLRLLNFILNKLNNMQGQYQVK